ncbi:uncharacterized protein K460DRAFT_146315 [Cucurbitaria berberidis CBS 394.84]|uniref:F-box domain-containing protein n=1 Tax=Cucurbitaria berberidis CBS 394.84 TaxID=1168544 RepID=A0A9P4GDG3_9PLEO|nr:uncharacterized protein K460DRAFT_146315 [Cucurbitaria berberidis CBS 394.84]KAF1843496.1 hypothetical protein K460DRAFT_146315 [Cucurbitaria berberidis CBS 394.84]
MSYYDNDCSYVTTEKAKPVERKLRQIDNSATAAGDGKPFPFLHLPAEIRNQVYQYVSADIEGPLRLYHILPCYHRKSNSSYISLNTVCRQIRAEFHPLFYHNTKIVIRLDDFSSFIRTYLDTAASAYSITQIAKVTVENCDAILSREQGWDILPLLQDKALNRDRKWSFQVGWRSPMCQTLNKVVNCPTRRLLGDIKSGIFSEIRFCQWAAQSGYVRTWKLVVRKREDKLNHQEKKNMERYCQWMSVNSLDGMPLWNRLDSGNFETESLVGVEIFVCNARGRMVEKYAWDEEKSRMEMVDMAAEKSRMVQGWRAESFTPRA